MKVFNTLSGQKEEFAPQGNEVKMYVCGVTPYDDAHIGHAMSYIIFDVIRRYLRLRGYSVKYVQNITDIDDKIIDRANRLGIPPRELAEKYTNSYFEDMDALNIEQADIYPRATEEIPKIIEVVQGLIDKGHAYPAQGSVYFRVRSVADYGKLAHRSLESMMAGARVEAVKEKEHPMDFVLWKASKPDEPSWESPWGPGRPGWHIECSAMSLKYLGETLDIHGGGHDLVFPHHENEIAQSESFTGKKPFAKYWLHNGLLQFGEDKMSKSLGNLITIKEARDRYSIDAIRLFVLHSHYRSPLTYDEITLDATGVALRAFSDAKWKLSEPYAEMNRSMLETQGIKTDDITPAEEYHNRFISAMDDDFNTAQAIATLFNLAQEINRAVNLGHEDKVVEHRELFRELTDVLGLTLPKPKEPDKPSIDTQSYSDIVSCITVLPPGAEQWQPSENESYIEHLAHIRNQLRADKQWQQADIIRSKLAELGITLEDTPGGTVWKHIR
ncbi:cysteine--tRNA ligase [Chloroflexota bacterium]